MTQERPPILDGILQQALLLTGAQGGAILLIHADKSEPVVVSASSPDYAVDMRFAGLTLQAHGYVAEPAFVTGIFNIGHSITAFGAATLGVLVLTCPTEPPARDIQLLRLFTEQAAAIISQERMIDSLRQNVQALFEEVEELEFIRQADHELSSRLDPAWIVKLTLDWALRRSMADAGVILGLDPIKQQVDILDASGFTAPTLDSLQNSLDMALNPALKARIFSSRTSLVIADVTLDPDVQPLLPQAMTVLFVPLISHRRTVGVLRLESRRADCFDKGAVVFIEGLASMASIALDNAQLLQQAEQLADDMALIHNGGRTMSSSLEWETAIKSVAQGLALSVKGASALLYSFDQVTQSAKLLASYYRGDQVSTAVLPAIGSTWELHRYENILAALQENRLITIDKATATESELDSLEQWQIPVAAIAPLVAQEVPIGLAILLKNNPPYHYAPSEVFVVESIATQAAAVLRQATLYTEVLELETLKSEMIGMASHDLRGPIANAMGYIGLVEEDVAAGRYEDVITYLGAVKRSLGMMESLVQDLLNLEKVESQGSQNWELFLLDELVCEVVEEQQAAARLKAHDLTTEISPGIARVHGNRTYLRQAVVNLVSNGIKYTPDNGQVRARVFIEAGQRRAYFEVIDNGLGIPANRQPRIFQRFYRAKQTGTENIAGTGLGLSLVKSIVERSHGGVYFTSEAGQGSTFGFWLPLKES